jgi:hypothetical protein
MSIEASQGVDVRNVCPKSGQECDFFIKLNDEFTSTQPIDSEVLSGLSPDDSEMMLYSPQRHAAAVDGARRIAVRDCVTIDANCGMPSQQKSRTNGHSHH